ncbi:MFS transporter (plasmid) [Halomicrobium sp. HM KBTZ05]|uniref:MFS transporter n=1 Tax=Halomicrobium sp. HM KBTZ05 TaxID=3242663 RepID=UPI003555E156
MERGYRHVVLASCVLAFFGSRVGQLVISPLVPEITGAFEVSKGAIGAALTGMWAAYALVQYPAGVFGDRFGERPVVLVSLATAAVGSVLLAVVATFPLFVLVVVALGAGVGLYYNAGTTLLTREFDGVGRAIGVHRIGGQAAGLLAPISVAAVTVRFGWRAGLLVGAVAAPILLLFWVTVRPTPPRRPDVSVRQQFDAGLFRDILSRPVLAYGTAVAVLAEFVGMAATSFLPTFLVAAQGLSLQRASLLFSLYFVVLAVAQPATGWLSDAVGRARATMLALASGVVGYALLVGATGLVPVVVGVTLAGYAMSWSTPIQALFLDQLGRAERGTGFGLVRTVYVLLGSLGSVVTGGVADRLGWMVAFGMLGLVLLSAAGLVGAAQLANVEAS